MVGVTLQDVTVIIPQFEQADLTSQCITQLLAHHPQTGRILVVDDGSSSSQVRLLHRSPAPQLEIIRNANRQGVTAAWNTGLRAVNSRWVILLNNDVRTEGPWIEALIAPLLVPGTRTLLTGVAKRYEPELPVSVARHCGSSCLLEGWCLAAKENTLRSVGGFDERFFLYYSDTDLQCQLLLTQPDSLQAVPGLPLRHLSHQSTKHVTQRQTIWQADRMRFRQKWSRTA